MHVEQKLAQRVFAWLEASDLLPNAPLAVAVSGGSDSMALLELLSQWKQSCPECLIAVSVDHGLRPEAKQECNLVANFATHLGHRHCILRLVPGQITGNLLAAARRERYRLISDWAHANNISTVALGHTMNDQAETFLLNLARGSGIDGLSAMQARFDRNGIAWIRPLLNERRGYLQDYLRRGGRGWCEDPSNVDSRFDRPKVRQALCELEKIGISAVGIAATAARLGSVRTTLTHITCAAAWACAEVSDLAEVTFSTDYWTLEEEVRRRLAVRAIRHVNGAEHPPRHDSLLRALKNVRAGRRATLCGCILTPESEDGFHIGREPAACAPPTRDDIWDGRWQLIGTTIPSDAEIAALGYHGTSELTEMITGRFQVESLHAAPGLWQNGKLLAGPLPQTGEVWRFIPRRPPNRFFEAD